MLKMKRMKSWMLKWVECVDTIRVCKDEGECSIRNLQKNKSCGSDGLFAEHLMYADKKLVSLLSQCFSSMLIHGFLPESLIDVILVPVIKDKNSKISCKDNYRPIVLANIMSKVLESIWLNKISDYFSTKPNQFGFKRKHSTDMCIFLLKEAIELYKRSGSCVYACFIDASKAFDRINHDLLFLKLNKCGVPSYIVRILSYWYRHQTVCIWWAGILSDKFNVTNGVRQGEILSPYLFNLYMNDLSDRLLECNTGCMVGDEVINHLMYADDLIVCSPTASGLRQLLNVCSHYGESHDIK